jgi:DNA-binding NarL/FixJ family response regulator
MDRLKLLIVDDNELFRKSLHLFIKKISSVEIVGEALNGFEALEMVEKTAPDIVLMDIAMPMMNGIEATRTIKQRWPSTVVMLMTNYDAYLYEAEARQAQADVFLSKFDLKTVLHDSLIALSPLKHRNQMAEV